MDRFTLLGPTAPQGFYSVDPGRRLTHEEIAALYPGASIALNPNPRTQEERFQRIARNQKARKSDYRSMYGYRE